MVNAPVRREYTSFNEWIIDRTGGRNMVCLTCTKIASVYHARYGLSHAKDLGICGLWYNYIIIM